MADFGNRSPDSSDNADYEEALRAIVERIGWHRLFFFLNKLRRESDSPEAWRGWLVPKFVCLRHQEFPTQESFLKLTRSREFEAFFLHGLGEKFHRTISGIHFITRGLLTLEFEASDGNEFRGRFFLPVETSEGLSLDEPKNLNFANGSLACRRRPAWTRRPTWRNFHYLPPARPGRRRTPPHPR